LIAGFPAGDFIERVSVEEKKRSDAMDWNKKSSASSESQDLVNHVESQFDRS
jgi:hypothetical protein